MINLAWYILASTTFVFASDLFIHERFKSNGIIQYREVDRYLRRYGYLRDYMEMSTEEAFENDRTEAIKRFQHYMESFASGDDPIYVTGKCDDYTLIWMSKKRCGCEDMPLPKKMMRVKRSSNLLRFKPQQVITGPRWPTPRISWSLGRLTNQLRGSIVRNEMIRAFRTWSDVSALEFTETRRGADIEISFEVGDHNDGSPFDGDGGVLAHAFYPTDGTTHFDNGETWKTNSSEGIDFFTVAAHEIGHAIGLRHSSNGAALMAPFYAGYNPNFKLHQDDIMRIQAIYGAGRARPIPREPEVTDRVIPTTTVAPPDRNTPGRNPPDGRPDICFTKFEGITRDDNGDILAFVNNRQIMRMTDRDGMVGDLEEVTDVFPDGPSGVDDIVNVQSNGFLFFRRYLLWNYQLASGPGNKRELMSTDYIPDALNTIPEQMTASFRRSFSTIFMFGSSMFWMFDTNNMEVVRGSHRRTSDFFRGLPSDLDAAFRMNNRIIYFFKGSQYYTYDEGLRTIRGPRDIGPAFIKGRCGDRPK